MARPSLNAVPLSPGGGEFYPGAISLPGKTLFPTGGVGFVLTATPDALILGTYPGTGTYPASDDYPGRGASVAATATSPRVLTATVNA